jgi:hypothetical protein
LQNYPRTDKKKEGEQKIQYTFELIDWFFSCRLMLKRFLNCYVADCYKSKNRHQGLQGHTPGPGSHT